MQLKHAEVHRFVDQSSGARGELIGISDERNEHTGREVSFERIRRSDPNYGYAADAENELIQRGKSDGQPLDADVAIDGFHGCVRVTRAALAFLIGQLHRQHASYGL